MLYCENIKRSLTQKSHHFLVIEDSEFLNKTIVEALSKNKNYDIDWALDFHSAKELLEKNSYDFILLDLNLPDAYGEELVANVGLLSKAKIIILTAEEDVHMRETLFKSGILDYLVKDKNFSYSLKSIEHIVQNVEKNSGCTILVIDDSRFMCKYLQNILNVHNYNVITALNAQEGLEALQKHHINVVILDMELPDKHGLDFLREMKEEKEFCHIPVIVLSGTNNPEIVRSSLKAGASDFIKKPFNTEELTLKVALSVETNRKYTEVLCSQKMLEEYKLAINDSSIVSKTDINGVITYVNDEFCRISGYTKDELLGKPHNIVRHPDMSSSIFQEVWECIASGKPWRGTIKNRAKDGSSYFVKSVINPIVDADGEILEYIAIRTDVSELETYKELLQDELKSSNDNLLYLKQHEDAMAKFVSVLKTDTSGTITYANKNFLNISGYSESELFGKKCSMIRAQKHIENSDCEDVKERLLNFETVEFTFENLTKDKKSFFSDTTIVPIFNENSEVVEHLHLMYDITEIATMHQELEDTQKEIIYRLGEVGESRSQETGNHVKRVAEYSKTLALLAGLSQEKVKLLESASPMHDIGKVGIPDAILKKPGKLTHEEFEIMKSHSTIGFNILKKSRRPIIKAAATVAYTHHEKWDGSGYPKGAAGERIHIFGRITAITDVFDALGSERCYKKAWPLEKILRLFEEEKGKHFDPNLITLFLDNIEQFTAIQEKYKDDF